MSKLKISDLSFYETDFDNSSQVRGGMSLKHYLSLRFRYSRLLFPIEESEVEFLEESVGKKGETIRYFYDETVDGYGFVVSKDTDSGTVLFGVAERNVPNGKSVSSFALVSS